MVYLLYTEARCLLVDDGEDMCACVHELCMIPGEVPTGSIGESWGKLAT